MLGRILTIALNTYRESVRARILLGLAGVSFAVAFYSIIVGAYTLKNAARVVSDLGAASISLFGIAVSIVIAATSLYRELEQKTIFPILARPIGRGEYLVGKYVGTLATLAVFIMADAGLVLFIGAALSGRSIALVLGLGVASIAALVIAAWRWPRLRSYVPIPWAALLLVMGAVLASGAPDERRVVLAASLLALLEIGIVAAVAMVFASFSTPFLSALFTLGVFIIGRNADSLARLPVRHWGKIGHDAGVVLSKITPNLQVYVPPRPLLTGEAEANLATYMGTATITALAWAIGLLAIAAFVFRERDFL